MEQSAQKDSSLPLDVNAMSAVPENHEDPDRKVSDSLTLNLYGLQCDLPLWVDDTIRGRSRD